MKPPDAMEAILGVVDILDATGDMKRAAAHLDAWASGVRREALEECYRTVVQWGQRRALEMVKKLIDKEPKK